MFELKEAKLKVGDVLICSSQQEMLTVMKDLLKEGIETDFVFSKDNTLIVTKIHLLRW